MLRIVGAENPGSIERLRERDGREEGRERERERGDNFFANVHRHRQRENVRERTNDFPFIHRWIKKMHNASEKR